MPNKPISKKEQLAWDFAKEKHAGQIRKFIGLPYFDAHVQKVNGIIKLYTTDEDLLCAALLHDTLEDCDVTYDEIYAMFGERVADIVQELTSIKDVIEADYAGDKTDYLIDKMVNMSDDALLIKLCDRLLNISDAFTASEKFRTKYYNETKKIMEDLKSFRHLNKLQKLVADDINVKLENINAMFKIDESKKYIKTYKLFTENIEPMKKISNEPNIKFNGGNPVCICNNCRTIIERVKYVADKCLTLDGGEVPLLCDKCKADSLNNEPKIQNF